MERYTIAQRTKIVTMFLENNWSVVLMQRAYRQFYNVHEAPSTNIIYIAVRNFEERGTVADARILEDLVVIKTIENIARVQESVADQSQTSIRRCSAQLAISRRSLQRILSKDLHHFSYKIQEDHDDIV